VVGEGLGDGFMLARFIDTLPLKPRIFIVKKDKQTTTAVSKTKNIIL